MKASFVVMELCLLAGAVVAQAPAPGLNAGSGRQGFSVRGMVTVDRPYPSLSAQLVPGNPSFSERVEVNPDGSFEFHSAVSGTHQLLVTSTNGEVLYDGYVHISGPADYLSVSLHPIQKSGNSRDSSISIQQLQHHVPAAAQQAFDKARHASSKGHNEEAARQLHRALAIDPDFADAHTELAVLEAGSGQLIEASVELQKAVDLVPDHKVALANLSIVLGKLNRYEEAGEVAARALRLDPTNAKVHFILAISLIRGRQDSTAALNHLNQAASEIPMAHVLAADLLSQAGRSQDALSHLEEFLRTARPDDPYRSRVEARISELRKP